MEISLCSIALLLIVGNQAYEYGHGEGSEIADLNGHNHGHYHHHDDYEAYSNIGHDDIYHDIFKYRPCFIHDKKCIFNFFNQMHMCPKSLPPKPYIIKKSSMDAPQANFTFTIYNAELRGLESGKVKELFINNKTDTLVFEVEFETLVVDSPKSLVTYYRKGKEPVEIYDFSFLDFKNTSLTLLIRNLHDPNLIQTHVYAYLSDPNLPFMVGPRFGDSKALKKMKYKWLGYVGLSAREAMVKQAPLYMSAYLHSQICDYKHL